jgi:hypothetical protein
VRGARLQFQQKILVELVVFRRADVVSGEGADACSDSKNVTIEK